MNFVKNIFNALGKDEDDNSLAYGEWIPAEQRIEGTYDAIATHTEVNHIYR